MCDTDRPLSLPGHYLIDKQVKTRSKHHTLGSVCVYVAFVQPQWASSFESKIKMAGNKPRFVILDSWMIPGPEEAREWEKGASEFTYRGQIHLNSDSNDFLLRKLGLQKQVQYI